MGCYLTIVIAIRADGYIPDQMTIFSHSLTSICLQLYKVGLSSEIIIVHWNPPKNNNLNKILCKLNINFKNLSIKLINVDEKFHQALKYSKQRKFSDYAYNVGIRRAKGEFVICKAPDTYFSSSIIEFVGKQTLDYDSIYRADRINICKNREYELDLNWEMNFKKHIIIRKCYRGHGLHTRACGDFLLMRKKAWDKIGGWPERGTSVIFGGDGEILHAAIGLGLKQKVLKDDNCVFKIAHAGMFSLNDSRDFPTFYKSNFHLFSNKIPGIKIVKYLVKIILGFFNLPKHSYKGIPYRSRFRYFLIAEIRKNIPQMNFLFRKKNWGLKNIRLDEKYINIASWDLISSIRK